MKRILNYLLGLLGVGAASCIPVAMYGTPHVEFSLSARVIDEAGNPIQGIEVRTKRGEPFDHNTGIADYLGNIEAVSGSMWPDEQYEVVFLDVDGEYNGGEFESLELDIRDKVRQTKKGSGDWYQGTYKAELGDVTLTLKAQDDNNTNEEESL
ncbi:MAG: radical SAM-associated putative lipoprotein [Alistipes sp.]|nr:radical SAM-associated putative lipoprotein [Alistipes sp.]